MIKYIDKGTARQHLTDRLMESAFNNFRVRAYVDDVYVDIIDNRLPVWLDELQTADVVEVRHGRWKQVGDNTYRCSVCGELSCCCSPYCGECGAKMDEECEDESR